jgi:methylated-DNA-[protein]-cysteine S-methyltransferase
MRPSEETCFLKTPVGWVKITADVAGVTSIHFLESQPPPPVFDVLNPHLKEAYRQLGEYFRGERSRFTLTLNPKGTDFQRRVWDRLAKVPFGTTVTYAEIAAAIGKPGGARAVGMANNKNPLPIVVPCHRVIGSNGSMVGFGAGIEIKEKLLDIEGIERAR